METFDLILRRRGSRPEASLALTDEGCVRAARRLHETIPGYGPTPLVSLPGLARALGVGAVYVKDESKRFGLNAFKGLGGSYAMAGYLAGRLGVPLESVSFEQLCAPEVRERLGEITFYTATDGNHGRGVAWAARMLGQRSVVYMPKGSALERLENIRAQGAQAEITDLNYDDAVRLADEMARTHGGVLIQDTAWPGYEEIPRRIMQGYTTLAGEIAEQLADLGEDVPTHLFLQAGVGSFAGAVLGTFAALWGDKRPCTIVVEPDRADCLYRTAKADDGQLHFVTGEMNSMMAGLCCGEPCTVSWPILDSYADGFLSCSDAYSALGMRLLGRPQEGDPRVVSGESGAVGAGVLAGLCREERLSALREQLGLGPDARVLLISTEGDTDRENYRRILSSEN